MTWSRWIIGFAVMFGVPGAILASTSPPTVLHRPPMEARRNAAVTLSATIEGELGERPQVMLFYRGQTEQGYHSIPMTNTSAGYFDSVIPAEACTGFAVRYYFEVTGARGEYVFALGSAKQPMSFELSDPVDDDEQPLWDWNGLAMKGGLGALPFLLIALLHFREKDGERAIIDRRFWIEVLLPLLKLRGQPLTDEITRLSQLAIRHPIDGKRTYSRRLLSKRMRDVRRVVALLDQLFWIETLRPIEHLRGDLLKDELQTLARRVLTHPLQVSQRYTPGVLLHKLEDIRGLDRGRLEAERDRLVGSEFRGSRLRVS